MAFRLDQFEIREVLGAGGMAVVYAATDLRSGSPVALKVMTTHEARDAAHRRAFVSEVRSAARLSHPGIVRVLDVGEVTPHFAAHTGLFAAGAPYLVMERVDGVGLDRIGDIDWPALRRLVLDLLDALAHAHALGVIHRDIKPSNILVDALSRRPRLTDFGIARTFDLDRGPEAAEAEHRIAGTPNYMAPERVLGNWRDQGPWTDLYSLGILVWKIATGEHPYRGSTDEVLLAQVRDPLPEFVPRIDLPERLELWLAGMLAKAPHARFRRAADAAAAFVELSRSRLRQTPSGRAPTPDEARALPTLTNVLERPPQGEGYLRVSGLVADWQRPPVPADWRAQADALDVLASPGIGVYGLRIPPMVGREAERDALWAALIDVVQNGRMQVAHVCGAPGVGKTRLGEWFVRRALELGVADVHRIVHSGLGRPADGLNGALRRLFRTEGLDEGEIARRVRAELDELPAAREPFAAHDAAVLARMLSHRDEDGHRSAEHLSPTERFYTTWRLLRSLGAGRAQILWIEDAHMGIEGLRFARFLVEHVGGELPLLLLLTTRTEGPFVSDSAAEDLALVAASGAAQTLTIGPLDDPTLRELVRRNLELAPELADEVVRRAHGVPMFAVQAVDEMVERDALARSDHGYAFSPSGNDLPDDAQSLWFQRLERVVAPLGSHRELGFDALLVGALLGRWVDATEWAATLRAAGLAQGVDASQLPELLDLLVDQLQRRGFAGRQRGGWLFAHTSMRDALLRIARERGRWTELHLVCAASLCAVHRSSPGLELRVAGHLEEAGELESALDHVLRGIAEAKVVRDNDWLERLLARADRLLGQLKLSDQDERRGVILATRARVLTARNRLIEARDACEALIVEASEHGWVGVEGEATYQLGSTALSLGHTERAIALFQRSATLCRHAGDPHNLARSREGIGYAFLHQGRFDEARPHIEAAGVAYTRLDDLRGLCFNYYHRGIIARYEGDLRRARALYDQCLELSGLLAFRDTLANAHNALGDLDRQDGDLDGARSHYREAYALWSAVGAAGGNVASINLGITLVQQGRWDDAAALLLPLAARLDRENAGMQLTFALAALLPVHAGRGEHDAFDAALGRFGALRREFALHDPDLELLCDICVGKWHRDGDRGRVDTTRRAFED